MLINKRNLIAVVSFGAMAALGLSGCASDDEAGSPGSPPAASSMDESSMAPESAMAESSMADSGMDKSSMGGASMESGSAGMGDPTTDLVGPGCAAYAEQVPDGAGSVVGMSQDPVAVAASNNPLLTTLVSAVSGELNPDVDLVSTLNGSEFTVFAPVDEAFAAIDADTIETLKTDSDLLTSILTYHVVPGQILPDAIAGEHETVQGGSLTVAGEGDDLTVNDAKVICGGVHTANATVYLIDGVLMPPAK